MRIALVALLLSAWCWTSLAADVPLPTGVIARLGSNAFRHDSPIRVLAHSPDGKVLACGGDGSIGLFDAQDGRPLREFTAHRGDVVTLAFSPSGDRLASAGADGVARLWKLTEKTASESEADVRPAWSCPCGQGGLSYRTKQWALRFAPDGKQVVLTDSQRAFWTIDAASGRVTQQGVEARGQLASLSTDGGLLYVACTGNKIGVRETATGRRRPDVMAAIPGVRFSIADAAASGLVLARFDVAPDGLRTLLGTERTLAAAELASGKVLGTVAQRRVLGNERTPVRTVFSPDAKQLAVLWSTIEGTMLEVHAWPDGKELHRFALGERRPDAMAFSPDGRRLAVADGSQIRVWDTGEGKEILGVPGHGDAIVTVVFSGDGSRVATAALDGTARLWQSRDGKPLGSFPAACSLESEHAVAFSPDGRLLAVDQGDAIALLGCEDGKMVRRLALTADGSVPDAVGPRVVAFSPDGKQLVAWSFADAAARRWDVASGGVLVEQPIAVDDRRPEPNGSVLLGLAPAAVFSPNLELLAATRFVGEDVSTWELRTGRRCFELKAQAPITSVVFSPDGRLLAVGRTSGLIQLWDPREDRLQQSLEGPSCGSFPRAFVDGGKTLVSDHPDNTSRFWDVASGREVFRIDGHRVVACSADGRYAASISPRQVVFVWELSRVRQIR